MLVQLIAFTLYGSMNCDKKEQEKHLNSVYVTASSVTSLKDEEVVCGKIPYYYCVIVVDHQRSYGTFGKCDRIANKVNGAK